MPKPLPHAAFAAMLAESKRTRLPEAFQRDLTVHDHAWVTARDPKRPFMWCLRRDGTHVWDLESTEAHQVRRGSTTAHAVLDSIARGWPEARFYLWDGHALQTFASTEAAREGLRAFMEREVERAAELAAKFCQSNPSTPHDFSRGAKCCYCEAPKPITCLEVPKCHGDYNGEHVLSCPKHTERS